MFQRYRTGRTLNSAHPLELLGTHKNQKAFRPLPPRHHGVGLIKENVIVIHSAMFRAVTDSTRLPPAHRPTNDSAKRALLLGLNDDRSQLCGPYTGRYDRTPTAESGSKQSPGSKSRAGLGSESRARPVYKAYIKNEGIYSLTATKMSQLDCSVRCHTLPEYRRKIIASAVTFRPVSESSDDPFPNYHPIHLLIVSLPFP
ncbi:hypothetical protein EVAR_19471_1 [Eumeta japonica]|uniref:Uncharacterized protein n=1 Tax=Eumeta variegata TaxID=151549 RepID=A0A4C1V8R3_EUMVA|nr:hypothetical protein EVAR_19471_1 [Eumeta japonica]